MSHPLLLVTGDVVLDCHLYGSMKTGVAACAGSPTCYTERLGGAALTHALLAAAAAAAGDRYAAQLAIDTAGLEASLPTHLRSYGVWTDQPSRKGATKDRVWRVDRSFGYGPVERGQHGDVLKRLPSAGGEQTPALTVLDEGALLFRHGASRAAWPDLGEGSEGHFLLKTSWPLCRGDLWPALGPVMDRLIVVVSAADLRRGDLQINARLSWEQCAEDTLRALHVDPIARDLLCAAHVVVTYGSAGALWVHRGRRGDAASFRLLFDRELLEGDDLRQVDGTVYGFQTARTAGIAHHLMARHACAEKEGAPSPFKDGAAMRAAIEAGTSAGLIAARLLLDLGHGRVDKPNPGFPVEALAASLAKPQGGYIAVEVPSTVLGRSTREWTLLEQSEGASSGEQPRPLTGLALLTARYGAAALSHLPALRLGPLFTVDRSEIESLRMLEGLIRGYEAIKVQPKPLSIGVFGPPGAGKSFGVKALTRALLGDKAPFLEFNLSQFKSPDELIGAFHRVRDAVLVGITPVAFWDEFDSQRYKWLQYLLAPMQDGAFQEGQITHPIGKCIFVFAGGTSPVLQTFGVPEPAPLEESELAGLAPEERAERRRVFDEQQQRRREYVLLKGPDFVSRLHGFLNVLGPNARTAANGDDITWPIRRALILRGILRLKDGEELDIDTGLLNALLAVPVYRHGARSFEKIVNGLVQGREADRLARSALPPRPLLERETDAAAFETLLSHADAFKNHPDMETLAAAVHRRFLDRAARSRLDAEEKAQPHLAWTIHPSVLKAYEDLGADLKASNRAAARRVPDHLALIGYTVEPQQPGDAGEWRASLAAAIEKHLERLAQAEHLGFCSERTANGWIYGAERNDELKHHPLLVPWAKLTPADQDKDRQSVRAIPDLLAVARFRAVPADVAT